MEKQIEEMARDLCHLEITCDECTKLARKTGQTKEQYCKAMQYAKRAYNADYRKQAWISVDERVPEKATDYLCRCVIRDNIDFPFFMVLRYLLVEANPHFQHECEDGLHVTHWMPIHQDPKMKGEPEK